MDILMIFIMGMAFQQSFVWRNDIFTALGKKIWLWDHNFFPRAVEISFLHTKGCSNAPLPLNLLIFCVIQYWFFHFQGFYILCNFNGFITRLQDEIPSFQQKWYFLLLVVVAIVNNQKSRLILVNMEVLHVEEIYFIYKVYLYS